MTESAFHSFKFVFLLFVLFNQKSGKAAGKGICNKVESIKTALGITLSRCRGSFGKLVVIDLPIAIMSPNLPLMPDLRSMEDA